MPTDRRAGPGTRAKTPVPVDHMVQCPEGVMRSASISVDAPLRLL